MIRKNNWFVRFLIWINYYKGFVPFTDRFNACVKCDAKEDCGIKFRCPCKIDEHLKLRV